MPGARSILGGLLLTAALAAAATPARANQDAVQFFRNIRVTTDTPVHDAVCFFCNVRVEGKVTGDIVVFFGGVRLNGEAEHDVVNFFGSISAADDATIRHDMVSIFGSMRLGENVTVGHDLVCIFGAVHAPGSVTVLGDRVEVLDLIFTLPAFVIFLVVVAILHERRAYRRRLLAQGYPFPPRQ